MSTSTNEFEGDGTFDEKKLIEYLDQWVVTLDGDNDLNYEETPIEIVKLRNWINELNKGKTWLEEQVNNWQKQAEARGVYIEELRNWIAKLEEDKKWLDEQVNNWQKQAEVRQEWILHLNQQLIMSESWLKSLRSNQQLLLSNRFYCFLVSMRLLPKFIENPETSVN